MKDLLPLKGFLYLLACTLLACSPDKLLCPKLKEQNFVAQYSFFVAGHTYGDGVKDFSFHIPFVKQIPYLNSCSGTSLGILTGDVVFLPVEEDWDSAVSQLQLFDMPIHIAPGNHDRGEAFEARFEPYYSFEQQGDLFIILNTIDWQIEGEQKDFLLQTLLFKAEQSRNIFIFCHELIWWSPQNKFRNLNVNYEPYYPGSTNYWSEISPVLEALDNSVTIFAGDLGANDQASPYMYYEYGNIRLVASGMGAGKKDNMIITEVGFDGEVDFNLVGINAEQVFLLDDLESFVLP